MSAGATYSFLLTADTAQAFALDDLPSGVTMKAFGPFNAMKGGHMVTVHDELADPKNDGAEGWVTLQVRKDRKVKMVGVTFQ